MSPLIPLRPWGGDERSDRPETALEGVRSEAEIVGRWEVRAAQHRALELACEAFGPRARGDMVSIRHAGEIRGLLRLEVPFQDLENHRARETTFLSLAAADPVLARIPLLYVLGSANE